MARPITPIINIFVDLTWPDPLPIRNLARPITHSTHYPIKLADKKAWATSDIAKNMQAQFVCLTHNLMLILEGCLEKEGVGNEIENDRRGKRLERALATSNISKEKLPAFLIRPKRSTQRSVKFIRWLRNHLYINTSWRDALGPLKRIYAVF